MASSGMLRRVALVRIDVSEELSASFIRESGKSYITPALVSHTQTMKYREQNNAEFIDS
jgi:hypothetical protein